MTNRSIGPLCGTAVGERVSHARAEAEWPSHAIGAGFNSGKHVCGSPTNASKDHPFPRRRSRQFRRPHHIDDGCATVRPAIEPHRGQRKKIPRRLGQAREACSVSATRIEQGNVPREMFDGRSALACAPSAPGSASFRCFHVLEGKGVREPPCENQKKPHGDLNKRRPEPGGTRPRPPKRA